jgi:elongation factor 1-alpha
LLLKNPPYFLL